MDPLSALSGAASHNPFAASMTVSAFLLAWLGGRHALAEGGLSARTAWPAAAVVSVLLGAYTFVVAGALGEARQAAFLVQGATLFGFYWARPRTEHPRAPRPLRPAPPGAGPASRAFQRRA